MPYFGFNFLWMFSWQSGQTPQEPDQSALDFLARHDFNFARVTTDYRFWTSGTDYFHPDETIFGYIDRYVSACQSRGIHLSLNQHRAPGYCINANNLETHNLWKDDIAQKAFIFLWQTFAERYRSIPASALSFDLLNEPPSPGQYGMTREIHADLMRRTVAAIRAIDPQRPITIDGLAGGNLAMPELSDLDLTQSGRGYMPMAVSHYQASWWDGSAGLPAPTYPNLDWNGTIWNRETLRDFYQPWCNLATSGVNVHIGECGCYNKTPNDVAMRWFSDLFGLYKEFGWGFSLWNFAGDFGIIGHGRPGTVYEQIDGYPVDRALFDLILASRVA